MNTREAIAACFEEVSSDRAENTARTYRCGLAHFVEHLQEQGIKPTDSAEIITIQHFIDYFPFLSRLGLSKGSLRVYISAAKYFADWLTLRNILRLEFADGLRFEKAARNAMKRRKKQLPRTPAKGSVEKMMEAVYAIDEESPRKERDIALFEFLYSTGCRANEVAQLKIKDIDLTERSAKVTGKGDKDRTVFFGTKAHDALLTYWKARGSFNRPDPAFCRHDLGAGKKIKPITTRTIGHIVEYVKKLAELDDALFTPHSFRHAFAIHMLRETKNLVLIQELMGHADPAATRVYAEIYPNELRDAHRIVFN